MKSIFRSFIGVLAVGAALLPATSIAQNGPPPAEKRGGPGGGRMGFEQMVARLDEAVTLTAEQKTKVAAIYKEQMAAMQAIPQEERREKMRESMAATREKVRAVLTPEQAKKFDDMPAPGRGGPGGPGGPGGEKKKKQN
jgi:Spy/CpxP family protein refolding chaperone